MEITPSQVTAEPKRFGPSHRALEQRRLLLQALKAVAWLCLAVVLLIFRPPAWWAELLKWAGAAYIGWSVWRLPGAALLRPLEARHLLLHEHALELNRDGFRRFVVFENLRHIEAIQGRDERLIALVLHTNDDSVVLRDLEGLGEIFGHLSQRKPSSVLIEVETRPIDWGEPLPWVAALGGAALLLALGVWFSGLQKPDYAALVGKWLLLDGGALALWRPASRGASLATQAPEVVLNVFLIGFGALLV